MHKAFKFARKEKNLTLNAAKVLQDARRKLFFVAIGVFVLNIVVGMILYALVFEPNGGNMSFIEILYSTIVLISTVGNIYFPNIYCKS